MERETLKKYLTSYYTLFFVWMLCAVYTAIKNPAENNFLIFRQVFWHTIDQLPLYCDYPQEYSDINLYGPLFSYIVAPFAIFPVWLGHLFWQLALSTFLFGAIKYMDFTDERKVFILWFCAHELLTALFLSQFNIAIAAIILLTFRLVEKEKDCWATLFIVIGTLTKLYGIVGLAFFFFSKHKVRFCVSLVCWLLLLIALPALISCPEYIMEQYQEWGATLMTKNEKNLFAPDENISLLGMVRKISNCASYSDLWLIIPGLVLFTPPYLRKSQYKNKGYRETLLASVMMFVVLFSTGSESYGYITPLIGVVIWYTACPWKRGKWDVALLVFVFVLTSLSPSDLFPRVLRETLVKPYSLKALPVTLVWLKLCYEMITKNYEENNNLAACIQ